MPYDKRGYPTDDRPFISNQFLIKAEPICFRVLFPGHTFQHNRFFLIGLDGIIAYIKQAGSIPCEVKRVAIDGILPSYTCVI